MPLTFDASWAAGTRHSHSIVNSNLDVQA